VIFAIAVYLMKKGVNYKHLFWTLISVLIVFALGVQFAYSQFATNTPSSGAWHDASNVVCNNCINSGNIANNAVTGAEIADGTITDPDVLVTSVFTRKINGANGWHFSTGNMLNVNQWYPLSLTGDMHMTQWAGSYVDIVCDDYAGGTSGVIIPSSGMGLSNLLRYNHRIVYLNPAPISNIIYSTTNNVNPPTNYQRLHMRLSSNNQNFEFMREYAPGGGWATVTGPPVVIGIEPQITNFECVIKLLSLCDGGSSFGATCT